MLSSQFIDSMIAPRTGETEKQIRERLSTYREPIRITETFGTLDNPVPLGAVGLAPNGLSVAIISTNLNATDAVMSLSGPPAPGNKYVLVHVRVENVSGEEYAHEIPYYFFGLIGSSGRIIRNSGYSRDVCRGGV